MYLYLSKKKEIDLYINIVNEKWNVNFIVFLIVK